MSVISLTLNFEQHVFLLLTLNLLYNELASKFTTTHNFSDNEKDLGKNVAHMVVDKIIFNYGYTNGFI